MGGGFRNFMISYEIFDGLGVFIFCYVTVGLRDKLDMQHASCLVENLVCVFQYGIF